MCKQVLNEKLQDIVETSGLKQLIKDVLKAKFDSILTYGNVVSECEKDYLKGFISATFLLTDMSKDTFDKLHNAVVWGE